MKPYRMGQPDLTKAFFAAERQLSPRLEAVLRTDAALDALAATHAVRRILGRAVSDADQRGASRRWGCRPAVRCAECRQSMRSSRKERAMIESITPCRGLGMSSAATPSAGSTPCAWPAGWTGPQTGCSPHVGDLASGPGDRAALHAGTGQGVPVLLVPSLINRSHIWDLRPGDSFVEDLQASGYDVYLVDWGVPDERDAHNSMATYVDEYLPAGRRGRPRQRPGADPVVMGHCFGGVIALLWAASTPEPPPALGVPRRADQLAGDGPARPDDPPRSPRSGGPARRHRQRPARQPAAGVPDVAAPRRSRRLRDTVDAPARPPCDPGDPGAHRLGARPCPVPRRRVRRHGPTAQPGERVGHRQCESRRPGTQPRRHQDPGSHRLRHLRPRHPAAVGDAARRRPRLRRRRGRRGEGRPHRPARRRSAKKLTLPTITAWLQARDLAN